MHVCGRVVLVISFFFFFFSFFLFRFPFLALVCCSFRFGAWTGQDTKKWWHVGHVWLCTPCTQTPLGYTFMCSSGVISQWPVSVKLDSQARCLPARFFFPAPQKSSPSQQSFSLLCWSTIITFSTKQSGKQAKREAGKKEKTSPVRMADQKKADAGEKPPMKYILVTGGVISGIGKGIISSSLGTIVKGYGLRPTSIKIDPYLNIGACEGDVGGGGEAKASSPVGCFTVVLSFFPFFLSSYLPIFLFSFFQSSQAHGCRVCC